MDEVILNGEVVGALRFSLLGGDKFLLRPSSAAMIAPSVSKSWIRVDAVAAEAIRTKKASALAVGVLKCDPEIRTGMDVLVLDPEGNAVSVGTSKMSSHEMMKPERGTAVKTRWTVDPSASSPSEGCSDWDQVIAANVEVMTRRVSEAEQFINKVVDENELPVAVSYSGGKDSLATLHLVLEAGIRPKLIFVDTGLEFQETRRNVEETAREFGLELIVENAGDSFWKNLSHFGPPAKDFRWCCKTCKLGPATQLIKKNFPDGVLSFIGQRAYESQRRAEKSRVWRNPWTPNQLGASPIQKWTALHVWIYLMSKKANVNPLYQQGLERIGCFMCPATDLAELRLVRTMSQDYDRWQRFLDDHAAKTGKPPHWLEYDLWRWKKIPKSVLDELGLAEGSVATNSNEGDSSSIDFRSTSGYNPCVEGLSMEGIFTRPLPMGRVANLLNIIGEVTTSPDGSIAEVGSVTVFREGPVMIKAPDEEALNRKSSQLKEVVFRAVNCAGCGICLGRCKNGALFLDGQVIIDAEKCDHCGSCLGPCPAVKFRDSELDI
jgi:phosphoadenosine phosphosulfate reductase